MYYCFFFCDFLYFIFVHFFDHPSKYQHLDFVFSENVPGEWEVKTSDRQNLRVPAPRRMVLFLLNKLALAAARSYVVSKETEPRIFCQKQKFLMQKKNMNPFAYHSRSD